MKRILIASLLLVVCIAARATAENSPKLKALWCTGGCCHDYKNHSKLLTKEMAKYASVEFDVVFGLEQFKNSDFAKDYDVVVYDLCYANEKDKDLIGNITETIHNGKPTVIVHCSLHNFRAIDWDDWREAMGMTSKAHDRFRKQSTKKVVDHPITMFWPEDWETPGEELYQCIKFWPKAKALLTMYSPQSKKDHPVAWTNRYGKARVFATTLGHDMLTVGQEDYHRLLANGLLWTCKKLDDQGNPVAGFAGTGK